MAQLKAEIIKLFVFFPRFSILSKIFKRLAFANHSLSTSLDFLFEQVRPSSAKRFTSNWTWTNEDYEEFWGRTVAELLFMKERVKKSCIEKWLRSIDPPPPDTNTLLEKLFELSHSIRLETVSKILVGGVYRSEFKRLCWSVYKLFRGEVFLKKLRHYFAISRLLMINCYIAMETYVPCRIEPAILRS